MKANAYYPVRSFLGVTGLVGGAIIVLTGFAGGCQKRANSEVSSPGPTVSYEPPALTPEERARAAETTMNDPHAQKRILLDDLYRRYGGGEMAQELKKESERTGIGAGTQLGKDIGDTAERIGTDVRKGVSGTVTKIDRGAFELRCESVGKGEEPVWPTDDRTKAFFQRHDVREECATVVRLNRDINERDQHD